MKTETKTKVLALYPDFKTSNVFHFICDNPFNLGNVQGFTFQVWTDGLFEDYIKHLLDKHKPTAVVTIDPKEYSGLSDKDKHCITIIKKIIEEYPIPCVQYSSKYHTDAFKELELERKVATMVTDCYIDIDYQYEIDVTGREPFWLTDTREEIYDSLMTILYQFQEEIFKRIN